MVIKLTNDNFEEEVIKYDGKVLVDLYADWCGPCKIMAPLIDELSEENIPNVRFGKVNVDESAEIAQKYGIMSIPTFLIIEKGEVIKSFIGVTDIDEIKKALM